MAVVRDNLRTYTPPPEKSEFWPELFVWTLSVIYGLAVGGIVAGVLLMAWMLWSGR